MRDEGDDEGQGQASKWRGCVRVSADGGWAAGGRDDAGAGSLSRLLAPKLALNLVLAPINITSPRLVPALLPSHLRHSQTLCRRVSAGVRGHATILFEQLIPSTEQPYACASAVSRRRNQYVSLILACQPLAH